MTTVSINSVGLCAHFSEQGDWAFDWALDLARRRGAQLNIFHFLADPFDPSDRADLSLTLAARAELAFARERELRFRYEERLGDFLDVGFRLCDDHEWRELHRCLTRREFQVLFLPWPRLGSSFGGKLLEEFVHAFVCPVVAVGPASRTTLSLNLPAVQVADQLGLAVDAWSVLRGAGPSPRAPRSVATRGLRA